jgi:hypothetical protein
LITLSKPILLTRNSSPILLSNFLYHQIGLAIRDYNLEDEILDLMGQAEGPGVIIKQINNENYVKFFRKGELKRLQS